MRWLPILVSSLWMIASCPGAVFQADDGTNAFTVLSGAWSTWTNTDAALNENDSFHYSNTPGAAAVWTVTNVPADRYLLYASYSAGPPIGICFPELPANRTGAPRGVPAIGL